MSVRLTDQFGKSEFQGLPYRHFKSKTNLEKLPLIVFLHGVGECGTDNESQLWYPFFNDQTSVFSDNSLAEFPCHIVAPQAQDDNRWVDIQDWGQSKVKLALEPTLALKIVGKLIEQLMERPEIDEKRVYVTGLSMGGFGVYELLIRNPNMFAAAVAICGGADLDAITKIDKIPMRIYHGNRDKVVPVNQSRMISNILSPRNASLSYFELDQVAHNAWEYAFRDETLFPWLFSQERLLSDPKGR